MDDVLRIFINKFPTDQYTELRELSNKSGALICKIKCTPDQVFEYLELIYGNYNDLAKDFLFIDDKSTWERYFSTDAGILAVYEYKGSVSIGYRGNLSEALTAHSDNFKLLIENGCEEYKTIKEKVLKQEIKDTPFINFLRAFGAVNLLLKKSKKQGYNLEALVLYASMIDAMLRMGIILKHQLRNRNSFIELDLIYQSKKKYISERKVYQRALVDGIIKQDDYKEISDLYDLRNKAVHRYFISDFEYSELLVILARYEKVYESFKKILKQLEDLQIVEGVGITKKSDTQQAKEVSVEFIKEILLKINSKIPVAIIPKRKRLRFKKNRKK